MYFNDKLNDSACYSYFQNPLKMFLWNCPYFLHLFLRERCSSVLSCFHASSGFPRTDSAKGDHLSKDSCWTTSILTARIVIISYPTPFQSNSDFNIFVLFKDPIYRYQIISSACALRLGAVRDFHPTNQPTNHLRNVSNQELPQNTTVIQSER